MRVKFWGTRGSIPTPGCDTVEYGGNTSCVEVTTPEGGTLILDAGSGIRVLGLDMAEREVPCDGVLLLTHVHWDHIQGFPFFAPVFIPGNHFRVYGNARSADRVEALLEGQMNPQFSPIYTLKNLGASIDFEGISEHQCFQVSNLEICSMQVPHGETTALAFQIKEGGKSLVYASDVGYTDKGPSDAILDFYRGADVLIHDGTYTPEEQADRRNRGLSSYLDAASAAVKAQVSKLLLFHYDQDHSDEQVDRNVAACAKELERLGAPGIEVEGAVEGMSFEL